jgi:prepilin signal peptidase PulO-like enzyme (type II secretory pathway)
VSARAATAGGVQLRDTLLAGAAAAALLFALATVAPHAGRVAAHTAAAGVLAALAVHDVRTRRVPNVVVYPALLAGVLVPGAFGTATLATALAGGAAAGGALLALALLGRGAMGMGDVKTMAFCGLLLGPGPALAALALASVAAAAAAAVLLATRRAQRRGTLPLVPWLAGATLVLLLASGGVA